MESKSVFIMILLAAAVSGPALAGGQGRSFGPSGSPMFHSGHFNSFARPGFVGGHNPRFVAAHGGSFHHHYRSPVVIIGGPFFAPYYYPYPYSYPYPYYYYPPVAMPYAPPAYIGQGETGPAEAYWYYCPSANAYYPHVNECPEGWQRVAPQPPPQTGY